MRKGIQKSWEERIADYIWKEFWITTIMIAGASFVMWVIDYPLWPVLGYFILGIALSIVMNFKRDFPKRDGS